MRANGSAVCGLLVGIAAVFLVATNVRAEDASAPAPTPTPNPTPTPGSWRGFYVGGGGTYSNVSVSTGGGGYDYGYDQGEGAFGYCLHAGVRVYRFVALEANYLDLGTTSYNNDLVYVPAFNGFYNSRVNFQAKVTEVSVLGILPFADGWEIYLRVGAGFWDGHSTQHLDESFGDKVISRNVNQNGTSLLLGMGAGVTFAKTWHVRLDMQTMGIDKDMLNTQYDTNLNTLLLEVQYRFGAH